MAPARRPSASSACARTAAWPCAAARIVAIRQAPRGVTVALRRRGERTVELVPFDWVVNCSGTGRALSGEAEPILRQAVARGLARPDACHRGLDVEADGGVIGRTGAPSAGLYALGPLTAGRFFEITAVPEIRVQCATVAERPRRFRRGGEAHRRLAPPRHRLRLRPLTPVVGLTGVAPARGAARNDAEMGELRAHGVAAEAEALGGAHLVAFAHLEGGGHQEAGDALEEIGLAGRDQPLHRRPEAVDRTGRPAAAGAKASRTSLRSDGSMLGPGASSTALWITFSSSRMLPGHG